MRLRYGAPFWLDEARSPKQGTLRLPSLSGTVETDVVIIGGGFTGCLTAETFAKAGVSVVLLERGCLGQGSAAASTALIMQEPDKYFVELAERYDAATAATLWRISAAAVDRLTDRLGSLDCGLTHPPSLHLALGDIGARRLRQDQRARRRRRLGGTLLEGERLARLSGIKDAVGILSPRNAVVDPYRATLQLAVAARRAGARLYARSRVRRIRSTQHGVTIDTHQGRVRARRVVLATGYATPSFKPLRVRFQMVTTYVIATERISEALRRRMGGRRVMFWTAEEPYHYFRWTSDGRILLGGEDRSVPSGKAHRRAALVAATRKLRQKLAALYPALAHVGITHAWDGLFATTPDGLPYIGPHPDYPHHLFALGYGGNGMTFSTLAAQTLLRHHLGTSTARDALFGFDRFRTRPR